MSCFALRFPTLTDTGYIARRNLSLITERPITPPFLQIFPGVINLRFHDHLSPVSQNLSPPPPPTTFSPYSTSATPPPPPRPNPRPALPRLPLQCTTMVSSRPKKACDILRLPIATTSMSPSRFSSCLRAKYVRLPKLRLKFTCPLISMKYYVRF